MTKDPSGLMMTVLFVARAVGLDGELLNRIKPITRAAGFTTTLLSHSKSHYVNVER